MSFILDALRKSESERQQSAVPSVTRVPQAVPAHRLPRWALGLMVTLAIGVLALAGAWWHDAQRAAPAASPQQAARVATPPPPEAREAAEPVRQSTPPQAAGRPDVGTTVPLRELAEPAAAPPQAAPVDVAAESPMPAAAPASSPAARTAPDGLPTAEDLIARGVSLPALVLQLHGYSDDPGQRFVFINGRRYEEGDRLDDGPRLLGIYAGGALLDHQGREFRLPRE